MFRSVLIRISGALLWTR